MMQVDSSLTPIVSVITPTYNHERFIGPCIESVLRQSYPNWEQIIIDDGSTDQTAKIIQSYPDSRIRYFHQENQGIDALAQTYNHALSLARGELVAVLEGDDLWPPDKLATLVPRFMAPELILAFGAVADVDQAGCRQSGGRRTERARPKLHHSILFNEPIGSACRFMLRAQGPSLIPAPTVVLRRSALEAIGGFQSFPGLRTTDYPTYLRLALEGKFFYEKQVMGFRRRHLESVTITNLETGHLHAVRCSREFMRTYGERLGLTPADRKQVEASWEGSRTVVDFALGRISLVKKDWQKARAHFGGALTFGEPLVCLASMTGLIFSWLHLDLEFMMKLFGRTPLR